jgi:hypothetical protein
VFAHVVRLVPHWLSPHGLGVDHWFWKTYVETYRSTKRFPPELPQYLLDEAQWYPPLFPLMIARLPGALFDRWSHQVAIIIDLLRLSLLLGAVGWQTDWNAGALAVAGVVYATTPIQVALNAQLNPRGLGALLLDALLLLLLWCLQTGGVWWAWSAVIIISGLILLTHKMTTQLFWFVALASGVLYRSWIILGLIPASIAAAMVLSRGFYWKILVAHWDIVSFWNRNWRWLGADPVRESPVYGDGTFERGKKLHKTGLKGVLWHLFILFGFNPAAWISCLLAYERLFAPSTFLIYPTFLLVWLLLPCAFAFVTSYVPVMKCLGAGYLYIYNTSLICSLLLALTWLYTSNPLFSNVFIGLALTLNGAGLLVYYWETLRNPRTRVDVSLERMLDHLRREPQSVVMCIPSNWHEVVHYKTGHAVLWGGHGYGFKRFEPIWPRLQVSFSEITRQYGVRYLLTTEAMVLPALEAELSSARVVREGNYRLYCFDAPLP